MPQRTIKFAGKDLNVQDAEIVTSTESFNVYTLADGSSVKVKGVLTELVRVLDQDLPDGSPIYIATLSPVVVPTKKA